MEHSYTCVAQSVAISGLGHMTDMSTRPMAGVIFSGIDPATDVVSGGGDVTGLILQIQDRVVTSLSLQSLTPAVPGAVSLLWRHRIIFTKYRDHPPHRRQVLLPRQTTGRPSLRY